MALPPWLLPFALGAGLVAAYAYRPMPAQPLVENPPSDLTQRRVLAANFARQTRSAEALAVLDTLAMEARQRGFPIYANDILAEKNAILMSAPPNPAPPLPNPNPAPPAPAVQGWGQWGGRSYTGMAG